MFQKTKDGIIYIGNAIHEYNIQRRRICFEMIYLARAMETSSTKVFRPAPVGPRSDLLHSVKKQQVPLKCSDQPPLDHALICFTVLRNSKFH
jgi:hypothetical protein